jgi:hypothetical protein
MIDPAQFSPAERRLVASFPAHLRGAVVVADRNAEERRRRELALTHEVLRCAGMGVSGGYATRFRAAARFNPTKLSGCVLDIDASDAGTYTTVAASLTAGSDFSNAAWTKTNVTVIANDTTDPDGGSLADRVTVSVATTPNIGQLPTGASNASAKVPTAFVFYIKRNDVNWIYVDTRASSSAAADKTWFDIQNVVVGTTGSAHGSVSITSVGSGWLRVNLTCNSCAGSTTFKIFAVTADNVTTSASVGQYFWLYGAAITEVRYSAILNKASGVSWANGTADLQPGFATLNGRTMIAGYGGQEIISAEAAVFAIGVNSVAHTLLMAAQATLIDSNACAFGMGASATATNRTRCWGTNINGSGRWRHTTINDAGTTVTSEHTPDGANATMTIVEFWTPGTVMSISMNGDTASPNAGAHNPGTLTCDRSSIMSRPDSTPDSRWTGYVGRVAAFNRELSAAERSYVRVGLGNQWAVAVTA